MKRDGKMTPRVDRKNTRSVSPRHVSIKHKRKENIHPQRK
jgi:hypothetical protein